MKVFISYSGKDQDLAKLISNILKQYGMDAWIDTREILPGENWAMEIGKALEESQAMVLLLTPESVASKWQSWEIEYALGKQQQYGKRLIPVFMGNAEEFRESDVPWILRQLPAIYLSNGDKTEEGVRRIAEALRQAA